MNTEATPPPGPVVERRTEDGLLIVAIDRSANGKTYLIHADDNGGMADLVDLLALRDALSVEIKRASRRADARQPLVDMLMARTVVASGDAQGRMRSLDRSEAGRIAADVFAFLDRREGNT